MAEVTVIVTMFGRGGNWPDIRAGVRKQRTACELWVWDNRGGPSLRGADAQFKSPRNLICWPRWFIAAHAPTELVVIVDDDLVFGDRDVVGDLCDSLKRERPQTLVGAEGVSLRRGASYWPKDRRLMECRRGRFQRSCPERGQGCSSRHPEGALHRGPTLRPHEPTHGAPLCGGRRRHRRVGIDRGETGQGAPGDRLLDWTVEGLRRHPRTHGPLRPAGLAVSSRCGAKTLFQMKGIRLGVHAALDGKPRNAPISGTHPRKGPP